MGMGAFVAVIITLHENYDIQISLAQLIFNNTEHYTPQIFKNLRQFYTQIFIIFYKVDSFKYMGFQSNLYFEGVLQKN